MARPRHNRPLPEGPDSRPLEALSFYLGRAYYNYKVFLSNVLRDLGLGGHIRPGMGHLLFVLFEQDGCIIRDIVERSGLTAGTVSTMLKTMQTAGLVTRRPDPDDRRAVRITLTPLARTLKPQCFKVLERLTTVLEQDIPETDLLTTKRTLALMIESMQENNCQAPAASEKRRNAS